MTDTLTSHSRGAIWSPTHGRAQDRVIDEFKSGDGLVWSHRRRYGHFGKQCWSMAKWNGWVRDYGAQWVGNEP